MGNITFNKMQKTLDGVIPAVLGDDTVDTDSIEDSAVDTDKIRDGDVAAVDLAATLDLSSKTITLPNGVTVDATNDTAVGAVFNSLHTSTTPAALDSVFELKMTAINDNDDEIEYAELMGVLVDPADGAEIGGFAILLQNGLGVLQVNPQFSLNGQTAGLTLTSGQSGAEGASLVLAQASGTPVANDAIGMLKFVGRDVALATVEYGQIYGQIDDNTAGAEYGSVLTKVMNGTGALAIGLSVAHDGADGYITTGMVENTANVGTVGTNCTVKEYGDGYNHVTVITMADVVLGAPTPSNNTAHGSEIYAFPTADVHLQDYTYFSVGLTIGGTQTDGPDIGIGSAVGTGSIATLNGTTMEDYVAGITWGATLDGTEEVQASVGANTSINNNATGDTKEVFFNAADGWAAGVTGNLTASGTVVIKWTTMV